MTKKFIIMHHSQTKDGTTKDFDAIKKYHMEVNGWSNIGYHYVIEAVNGKYEVLPGRAEDQKGAHTKELTFNAEGLGICLVGNFDILVPAAAQWQVALELVRGLMKKYGIASKNVLGHREAQAIGGLPVEQRKTCPGKAFNMDLFRAAL
ncbi:MAG: peptidoglycan recognition family protein [Nitrospiraceae bacterium]